MFNANLLDGIVIFAEVVKQGSFTKAATSSGHSTSYISKEITKLEDRLGTRLLNRTTRTLKLSPEGEVFFDQCEQLINDAKDAELQLLGSQSEPKGLLKVSCPIGFGISKLKPVMVKFAQLYPKVQVQLNLSDRKVDLVEEGIDVAIRASSKLDDSSLISRKLMSSKGLILASPAYLAQAGLPNSPTELSSHNTITYSLVKNHDLWNFEGLDGEHFQVKVNSLMQTNSPEMELQMCKSGLGIIRLPNFHLQSELENGELVELFPDYPKYKLDIFLVYPSRKHLSPRVRAFIDLVSQELGQ